MKFLNMCYYFLCFVIWIMDESIEDYIYMLYLYDEDSFVY